MIEKKSQKSAAFSLVEVVIAVGLFALSIVAIVGLLGPILDSVRESEETEIVSNLNEMIRAELERMPFTMPGRGDSIDNLRLTSPGDSFVLYGNRDLTAIGPEAFFDNPPPDLAGEIGDADKFFRVELRQSPAYPFQEGAAAEYPSRTFHVRVYWPAYRRTGPGIDDAVRRDANPEDRAELRQMNFFTTIRRK